MSTYKIAPSLLAADFTKLGEAFELINRSKADWLHLDVMDGVFVPNISYGMNIVKLAKANCNKFIDTHLMIIEPERYIQDFADAGTDMLTVHLEASTHLHRNIQAIKQAGMQAGVALNPHTPVTSVFEVLEDVDMVLIMSVNPGFGGQKFIYRSLHKIEQLKEEIITRNLDVKIEVDGGVGLHNAERILDAGADVLVAGSAIFKAEEPLNTIKKFKEISSTL